MTRRSVLVALVLTALIIPAMALRADEVSVKLDEGGMLQSIRWGAREVLRCEAPEPVVDRLGGKVVGKVDADGAVVYTGERATARCTFKPGADRLEIVVAITNTTDAVIKDTSTRKEPKHGELFALNLAGWRFQEGPAFIDPRFSGWNRNTDFASDAGFERRISYPGWGFAPLTALWDKQVTVGIMCLEPTIPYVNIRAFKDGNVFRARFELAEPIEPGKTLTRRFVLQFAAGGDWKAAVTPYKEFLHDTWPRLELRQVGPFHHTHLRREYFDKESLMYKPGTTWEMLMMPGARQAAAIGCKVAIFKCIFPHSGARGINGGRGHEFNPNYELLANIGGGADELKKVNQRIRDQLGLIPAAMTRVGVGIDEKGNLVRRDLSDPEQMEDQFRRIRKLIDYGFEGAYADQLAGFKENYRTIPVFLKKFQAELGDKFFMLAEHDWDVLSQYTHIIVNAPPGQTDALLAQFLTPDTPRYLAAKFANPDWKTAQVRRRYATDIGLIPWWLGPHYTPRVNEHDEAQICARWWRKHWKTLTIRPNANYIRRYLPEFHEEPAKQAE